MIRSPKEGGRNSRGHFSGYVPSSKSVLQELTAVIIQKCVMLFKKKTGSDKELKETSLFTSVSLILVIQSKLNVLSTENFNAP